MEDQAILKLNLDRFRQLLENVADPVKRQKMLLLIGETEAQLRMLHPSPDPLIPTWRERGQQP